MSQLSSSNGDQPKRKSDVGDSSNWTRLKRIRGTGALANVLETKRDITNPPMSVSNAVINNQRITEFGTSRTRRSTSTWTDYKAFSASYRAPNVVSLDSMTNRIVDLVTANPPPVPVISPEVPGSFFGQLESILASYTTPSTILVSIYNSVSEYYSRAPFSFSGSIYGFTSNTVTNAQVQSLPNGAGILIPQFTALTIGDSTYQVENVVGGRLIKTPLSGGSASFFTRNSSVTTTGLTPNVTFTYLGSGCPGLCSVSNGNSLSIIPSWDSQTSALSYSSVPGDTFYLIFYANGAYTTPKVIGTGINSVFIENLFSLPYAVYDVPLDYYIVGIMINNFISIQSTRISIRIRSPANNVVASNVTKNSATLTWDPTTSSVSGDNLIGYGIWDVYSRPKVFIADASSSATTYTVTGLTPATRYEFQVRPKYQSGYGAIGNTSTANVSTLFDVLPTIVATYNPATRLLSWVTNDPPPGTLNYAVNRAGTAQYILDYREPPTLTNPITLPEEWVAANVPETVSVEVILFQSGANITSNTFNVFYGAKVAGLASSNVSDTSLTLNWTALAGASSYIIYKDAVQLATSNTNTYSVTSLSPTTAYAFTVKAVYPGGNGILSNSLSVTTTAIVPTIVASYNAATRQLSWVTTNAPSGTLEYSVKEEGTNHYVTPLGVTYPTSPITIPDVPSGQITSVPATRVSTVRLTVNGTEIKSNTFNVFFGAKVTGLASNNITGTTVQLNWTTMSGATSYIIYKDAVQLATSNGNTYDVTSLSPTTAYVFTVKAVYSGGNGPISDNLNVTTTTLAALAVPENLRVTAVTQNSISYAWDPVTSATSYNAWYLDNDYTSAVNTSYVMDSLTPNTEYSFRVQSREDNVALPGGFRQSVRSNPVVRRTLAEVPTISSTGTTINWSSVAASNFGIMDGTTQIDFISGSLTTYNLANSSLSVGLHNISVKAFNLDNVPSVISNVRSIFIGAKVTGLASTNITTTSLTLNWTALAGATSYIIYKDAVQLATSNTNTYSVTSLSPTTAYVFTVKAVYSGGDGVLSDNLSVTTATPATLLPPTNIVGTGKDKGVNWTWTPAAGATGYNVYLNGSTTSIPSSGLDYYNDGGTFNSNQQISIQIESTNGTQTSAKSASVTKYTLAEVPIIMFETETVIYFQKSDPNSTTSYFQIFVDGVLFEDNVPGSAFFWDFTTRPPSAGLKNITMKAFNNNNVESALSLPLQLRFGPPPKVTGLASSNILDTSVTLSWNAVSVASLYQIYKDGVYLANSITNTYNVTSLSLGTTYGFRVRAVISNAGLGTGELSDNLSVTTSSTPVTTIVATYDPYTRLISWVTTYAPSGTLTYSINEEITDIVVVAGATTPYTFSTTPNAQIGFGPKTVTATVRLTANGITTKSNTFGVFFGGELTGLASSNITSTSVRLDWNSMGTDMDYIIFKDGVDIGVTSQNVNTYTAISLSPSTTYSFSIQPRYDLDIRGRGPISSAIQVTTLAASTPTTIVATYTPATRVLSWVTTNPPPGTLNYTILTGGSSYILTYNEPPFLTNPVTLPEEWVGANPPETVSAEVILNQVGGNITSNAFNVFYGAKVTGLNINTITATSLTLDWTALAGATSYIIYKDGTQVGTSNTNTYSVTSLSGATTYVFKVKAVYSGGNGVASSGVSVTTTSSSLTEVNSSLATLVSANSPPIEVMSPEPLDGFFAKLESILRSYSTPSTVLLSNYSLTNPISEFYSRTPFNFTGSIYGFTSNTVTNAQMQGLSAGAGILFPQFSALTIGDSTYQVGLSTGFSGLTLIKTPSSGGSINVYVRNDSVTTTGLTPNVTFTYLGASSPGLCSINEPLQPPTNIFGTPTVDSMTWSWNSANGATEYNIYLNGSAQIAETISTTSYNVISLDANEQQSIQIESKNATETSAKTTSVTKYTLAEVPTISSTGTTINWTSVAATKFGIMDDTTQIDYIDGSLTSFDFANSNLSVGLHSISVKAFNVDNVASALSNVLSVSIIGPKVTGLTSSNVTDTTLTLNWTAISGPVSYVIYQGLNELGTSNTNTYSVTSLSANTDYIFTVKAVFSGGDGETSDGLPVRTTAAPLDKVTGLTATSINNTSVTLEWTTIPQATSYVIYQGLNELGTSNTNTYTVSSLAPGTFFTFSVKARNNDGDGPLSDDLNVTTTTPTPTIVATYDTTTRVLSWVTTNAPSGTLAYSVKEEGTDKYVTPVGVTYPTSPITISNEPSAEITSLPAEVNASVRLTVNGTEIKSNAFNVFFGVKVTGLVVSNLTGTSFTLNWSELSQVSSYIIYKDTVQLATSNTNSYSVTGLSPNSNYVFSVKAEYSGGYTGPVSDDLAVSTPAAGLDKVTGLDSVIITDTTIALAWNAVTEATTYIIYENGGEVGTSTDIFYTVTSLSPNSTYIFTVKASNTESNGPLSDALNVSTLLPKVTGLTSSNLTSTTVELNWNALSGATSYNIVRNGTSIPNISGTSYSVTLLSPNTSYTFTVEGVGLAGNGIMSDSLYITTLLPKVTGLTSSNLTSSSVDLSWTAVTGADEYKIYDNGNEFSTSLGTSYSATGLTPETFYVFTVKASNANGDGPSSDDLTVSTPAAGLNKVTGLDSAIITDTTIALVWNAVTEATTYIIYENGSEVGTSTDIFYTVTSLSPNSTYIFTVEASNTESNGPLSDALNVSTLLPKVTGLTSSNLTSTTVQLNWNALSGATSYNILKNGTSIADISGTSYSVTLLTPNTSYTFTVEGIGLAGTGITSDSLYITTLLPKVTGLTSSNITSTSVDLSWNAVTGADDYDIYKDETKIATSVGTTYSATGLSPENDYIFTVKASNSNGDGPSSDDLTVSTPAAGLDKVTGLTSSNITSTSVDLSWNAVTGADDYDIYKDETKIATSVGTTYSATGLSPENDYIFTVKASNSNGDGPSSDDLTVSTLASTATLSPPTNIVGTPSSSSITWSWNSAVGATEYAIYLNGTLETTISTTTFTAGSLNANEQQSIEIESKNVSQTSAKSASVAKYTLAGNVNFVTSQNSTTINWENVPANYFEIFVDEVLFETTDTGDVYTWDFSGNLPADGLRAIAVKPFNGDNVGGTLSPALQKAFGTYRPPVTAHNVDDASAASMVISWTPPAYAENITGYNLILMYGNGNIPVSQSETTYSFPAYAAEAYTTVSVDITVEYNGYQSTVYSFSFTAQ